MGVRMGSFCFVKVVCGSLPSEMSSHGSKGVLIRLSQLEVLRLYPDWGEIAVSDCAGGVAVILKGLGKPVDGQVLCHQWRAWKRQQQGKCWLY